MLLIIPAATRPTRNGIEAYSDVIKLSAAGEDSEQASARLTKAGEAWGRGLLKAGDFPRVIRKLGLNTEDTGTADIRVRLMFGTGIES